MDEGAPNTINTDVVIMVFAVIIAVAVIAAYVINPSSYESTNWRVFIVTLSSLSIVMTFMFYYAVIELQILQYSSNVYSENQALASAITEVYADASTRYMKAPRFVRSLMPLSFNECTTERNESDATMELEIEEIVLSRKIFAVWDMTASSSTLLYRSKDRGCIATYLQWATSPYLRREWLTYRVNYCENTRKFGDILFSRAELITHYTSQAFFNLSEDMCEDDCFSDLM